MIAALLLAECFALVDRDVHQLLLGDPKWPIIVKEGDDVRVAMEVFDTLLALIECLLAVVQLPRLTERRLVLRREALELPLTHICGHLVEAGVGRLQLLVDGGHRLVLTRLQRAELLLVGGGYLLLELSFVLLVLRLGEVGFLTLRWRLGLCPRRLLPLRECFWRGLLALSGWLGGLGCGRLCRW
jgi:hypothetical protein